MQHSSRNRKKPLLILIGIVLGLVLLAHLLLPPLLLNFVNRKLADIPGYEGHIEDIDISLLRGAYQIEGFRLRKIMGDTSLPVFSVETADFSVEWAALFRGKIVSEFALHRPRLDFIAGPADTSKGNMGAWRETVEGLFPFTINRFEITEGSLRFRDPAAKPPVDIHLDNLHVVATGLTNAQHASEKTLPASFRATGRAMGKAPVRVDLDLAPLADHPTFDLNAQLEDLDMTLLNDFFRAYAGLDVERGTLSVFTEMSAADGRFKGYVKPLIRNLKVLDPEHDGNPLKVAWEAVAGAVAEIFENQPRDQTGTQIPFSGRFSNPDADLWTSVGYLLRNAFVRALTPGLDGSIHFEGGPTLEEEERQEKKERKRS